MNVVIIEDEIKAAVELKTLVERINHNIRVSALLHSVHDAVEWFTDNDMPDLILSDIHLGDGLSFDIFREVEISSPVIFCTAYDEYALRAFQHNGIDYLLKPIEKKDLLACFEKMKLLAEVMRPRQGDPNRRTHPMAGKKKGYLHSLLVYFRDRIIPIGTDKIDYIYTQNNVVFVNSNRERYEISEILDNLITQLDPQHFYRANRQFIINRRAVSKIEQLAARKLALTLNVPDTEPVIISKAKASSFLKWLKNGNTSKK